MAPKHILHVNSVVIALGDNSCSVGLISVCELLLEASFDRYTLRMRYDTSQAGSVQSEIRPSPHLHPTLSVVQNVCEGGDLLTCC